MAEEQAEQEPSIEEILDSIRQIISDDDEEGGDSAPEEAPPEPEPEAASEAEPEPEEAALEPEPEAEPEPEDIVDLTDKIEDEAAPEPEAEPEAEPESEPEEIEVDLQDIEPSELEPEPEPEETDMSDLAQPSQKVSAETHELIKDRAEKVTMEAFEELARTATIERAGLVTIEDVVRHEIRPLLKEWVDNNLPPLVERLLQKELDRIASRFLED